MKITMWWGRREALSTGNQFCGVVQKAQKRWHKARPGSSVLGTASMQNEWGPAKNQSLRKPNSHPSRVGTYTEQVMVGTHIHAHTTCEATKVWFGSSRDMKQVVYKTGMSANIEKRARTRGSDKGKGM